MNSYKEIVFTVSIEKVEECVICKSTGVNTEWVETYYLNMPDNHRSLESIAHGTRL